jgi:hypothetical protein
MKFAQQQLQELVEKNSEFKVLVTRLASRFNIKEVDAAKGAIKALQNFKLKPG